MKTLKRLGAVAAVLASVTACEVFEDQSPDDMSFRMSGSDGQVVMVIYSQDFVAGVDELSVTQVQVFSSDTVFHVLPIDTIINITVERRFFVQVETEAMDTVVVDVRLEVDGRGLVNLSGGIFPGLPWRFVYEYNQVLTDVIEVIL